MQPLRFPYGSRSTEAPLKNGAIKKDQKWTHFFFFFYYIIQIMRSYGTIETVHLNSATEIYFFSSSFVNIDHLKAYFFANTVENKNGSKKSSLDNLAWRINIASGPEASCDRDCHKTHRLSISFPLYFFFLLLQKTDDRSADGGAARGKGGKGGKGRKGGRLASINRCLIKESKSRSFIRNRLINDHPPWTGELFLLFTGGEIIYFSILTPCPINSNILADYFIWYSSSATEAK